MRLFFLIWFPSYYVICLLALFLNQMNKRTTFCLDCVLQFPGTSDKKYVWRSGCVINLMDGLGVRSDVLGLPLEAMRDLARERKDFWKQDSASMWKYEETLDLQDEKRRLEQVIRDGGPTVNSASCRLAHVESKLRKRRKEKRSPRGRSSSGTLRVLRLIRRHVIPDELWDMFIAVNLVQAKGAKTPYKPLMASFHRAWIRE